MNKEKLREELAELFLHMWREMAFGSPGYSSNPCGDAADKVIALIEKNMEEEDDSN